MKLKFMYDKSEDVWCLSKRGKSSSNSNSQYPTKAYSELISNKGEDPAEIQVSEFIDTYIEQKNINIVEQIEKYQNEYNLIAREFHRRAEGAWGVSLDQDIKVLLTVNERCPYSIEENLFFLTITTDSCLKLTMHELWHFYTWKKFGEIEQKRLGAEKYNEIKEALTVLLNVVYRDLLPEGVLDTGYPQHKDLRRDILRLWKIKPDIAFVWKNITSYDVVSG